MYRMDGLDKAIGWILALAVVGLLAAVCGIGWLLSWLASHLTWA